MLVLARTHVSASQLADRVFAVLLLKHPPRVLLVTPGRAEELSFYLYDLGPTESGPMQHFRGGFLWWCASWCSFGRALCAYHWF